MKLELLIIGVTLFFIAQYIFRWKISSIYETMEKILSNSSYLHL